MSNLYHELSPIRIYPNECIGASLETLNNNYTTLYNYCTSLNSQILYATDESFGTVLIKKDSLISNTLTGLDIKYDTNTLEKAEDGTLSVKSTIISKTNTEIIAGKGVFFQETNDKTQIDVKIDNKSLILSGGALTINTSTLASTIQKELSAASTETTGVVSIGDGLTVTSNGYVSVKVDNSTLKLNDNKELEVVPQATQTKHGFKVFKATYDNIITSYSWAVPEGVFSIKIYAASGGGSEDSSGGDTSVQLQNNTPLIILPGGTNNVVNNVVLSNTLESDSVFVIKGVTINESNIESGINIFNNLRISNIKETYGELTCSTNFRYPGSVASESGSTGTGAVFYLKTIPGQNIIINVGRGAADSYPGCILFEY
jgi:hypothetical protein